MGVDGNAMREEVGHSVGDGVAVLHDHHASDACVVDELRTHETGLTIDEEPGTACGGPLGSGVANGVHFGVNAADFDSFTGGDTLVISETAADSAEFGATTRATIVALCDDDIPGGFDKNCPELTSGAIRRGREEETLANPQSKVFAVHLKPFQGCRRGKTKGQRRLRSYLLVPKGSRRTRHHKRLLGPRWAGRVPS